MKNYQSFTDALAELKNKGYTENFETQSDCLYCGDLDLRLDPDDFHVDEIYRFEGDASAEQPVLYAISSNTGVKGILVDRSDEYAASNGRGLVQK